MFYLRHFRPQRVPQEQRINLVESCLGGEHCEEFIHPYVFIQRELWTHLNGALDQLPGEKTLTPRERKQREQDLEHNLYLSLHAKVRSDVGGFLNLKIYMLRGRVIIKLVHLMLSFSEFYRIFRLRFLFL